MGRVGHGLGGSNPIHAHHCWTAVKATGMGHARKCQMQSSARCSQCATDSQCSNRQKNTVIVISDLSLQLAGIAIHDVHCIFIKKTVVEDHLHFVSWSFDSIFLKNLLIIVELTKNNLYCTKWSRIWKWNWNKIRQLRNSQDRNFYSCTDFLSKRPWSSSSTWRFCRSNPSIPGHPDNDNCLGHRSLSGKRHYIDLRSDILRQDSRLEIHPLVRDVQGYQKCSFREQSAPLEVCLLPKV